MEVRKYNFGENDFPAKICLGEVPTFSAFSKCQKSTSKF
jgi:hypothetical protein